MIAEEHGGGREVGRVWHGPWMGTGTWMLLICACGKERRGKARACDTIHTCLYTLDLREMRNKKLGPVHVTVALAQRDASINHKGKMTWIHLKARQNRRCLSKVKIQRGSASERCCLKFILCDGTSPTALL